MTEDFVPRRAAAGEPAAAPGDGRLAFMINGLSWPNTEKIRATVGDTLHWRIINASAEIHPMHLHGFYFRVDDFTPPASGPEIRGGLGRHVVTERMPQLTGMSITWSPDRSGNWIFHCHFARHIEPVDSTGHGDHATTGMGGLVLGIDVANKPNARAIASAAPKRRLRLVAIADSGFRATEPSLRFVLEERGKRMASGPAFSPTIELVRGEPVSITVVNQLREPTAVHWHGIELESYNDGVPGVSGAGTRIAPIIAPRDSFEVRFTPPRAGTFMYHSHVDEVRQQPAGLAGALIVREPGEARSPDDHVFFIKGTRVPEAPSLIEVNGVANPDTVVFTQGRPTRIRVIGLASTNSNSAISLTARRDSSFANLNDSMIQPWRQLAKDAFELPAAERVLRPARQVVGMGETFDFEFVPAETGNLRLEVRTYGNAGNLLARVPIKVVAPR
ncbi:MAG TPA: multicopper oxidase domain-containing protein [Gemmatimonadaceae bacterium]